VDSMDPDISSHGPRRATINEASSAGARLPAIASFSGHAPEDYGLFSYNPSRGVRSERLLSKNPHFLPAPLLFSPAPFHFTFSSSVVELKRW